MSYEKLLNEGKIQKIEKEEPSFEKVEDDLKFARKAHELKNYEWSMAVSYNAVLRAGNKFMVSLGFRAIGKEHHKHLFEFLEESEIDNLLVKYFDRIRRKRNEFIYRDTSFISESESNEILKNANKLVLKIRTFVLKNRTKV